MADAHPIPEDMTVITPHLVCEGGAAAIDFYKRAFGAEEHNRLESPDGKVLHATLSINGSPLFLADDFPDWGALGPNAIGGTPVVIHLYVEDADAAMAQAEEAGATVTMPVEDTFWGDRYGKVTDPFGHHWSIAHHIRDVPPEEMMEAAKAMFAESE